MPTLKQRRAINALPECGYSISQAMRKAGYTRGSSVAGSQYNSLRKFTSKLDICNPQRIKEDIDLSMKMAKQAKDITNINRNIELRTKIAGMIIDKSEVDNKTPSQVIISYGNTKPLPDDKPADVKP